MEVKQWRKPIKLLLFLITFVLLTSFSFAKLNTRATSFTDPLPKVLDLRAYKSPKKLGNLAQAKWYQKNLNWKRCTESLDKAPYNKNLQMWVGVLHLECLRKWHSQKGLSGSQLIKSFEKIEKYSAQILSSPFEGHKQLLINTFLHVGDNSLKKSRSKLEGLVDRNQDLVDHMDSEQRAQYYQILGELAWLRQKNDLARINFLRSYSFVKNSKVLNRLKNLKATGFLDLQKYNAASSYGEAEQKLWRKLQKAVQRGQTIKVATYGVEYLQEYSGSDRVSEAKRNISRFLKRALYLRASKYKSMRRDFLSALEKSPPMFLVDFAKTAYDRGYYEESLQLASQAIGKIEESDSAAKILLVGGRSAYYRNKWSKAEKFFLQLKNKFPGRIESFEAQYLLGLLWYRQKSYKKVIQHYENFLSNFGVDKWELQVRYWLWRALKNEKSKRAKVQADAILKSFPLTYYGLLVRFEVQKSLQNLLGKEDKPIKNQDWWPKGANQRWVRVQKLLELGWLDEAEREIDMFPDPSDASGFLIRARLWSGIFKTRRSMMDVSEAIDRDPSFLSKNYLQIAFPQKYGEQIADSAKEFDISNDLIISIIRQESAFIANAVSSSNAMGLMQLLRPTAKETARWLKVRRFNENKDIFDIKTNIRFGTHFLSRMVRKYKGVVPLALASYNVGPGNLDRWLSNRVDLSDWKEFGAHPVDDMWVDELPWGETSFYVKAILRNYLLYKIIFKGQDKITTPVWNDAQTLVTKEKQG